MRVSKSSKSISLQELCRFARAIEKRGNAIFTGAELAAELGVSPRTVSRHMALMTNTLGLKLQASNKHGSRVVGKWKFVDAIRRYYTNGE